MVSDDASCYWNLGNGPILGNTSATQQHQDKPLPAHRCHSPPPPLPRRTTPVVREAAIKSMMDKAIGDKASLVDVENDLIDKMEDCISQLGAELEESNARFTKMKGVREVREGGTAEGQSDGRGIRRGGGEELSSSPLSLSLSLSLTHTHTHTHSPTTYLCDRSCHQSHQSHQSHQPRHPTILQSHRLQPLVAAVDNRYRRGARVRVGGGAVSQGAAG